MSSSLKKDLKPSRVLEQESSSNKVDISANFEQNPLITTAKSEDPNSSILSCKIKQIIAIEDNAKNEDESSPGFKKIEV